MYKRSDNIAFNNTSNISKTLNQYTTDAVNNYNQQSFKYRMTSYNCIGDAAVNEHRSKYTNDNTKVIRIRNVKFNGYNYFTQKCTIQVAQLTISRDITITFTNTM